MQIITTPSYLGLFSLRMFFGLVTGGKLTGTYMYNTYRVFHNALVRSFLQKLRIAQKKGLVPYGHRQEIYLGVYIAISVIWQLIRFA